MRNATSGFEIVALLPSPKKPVMSPVGVREKEGTSSPLPARKEGA